MANKSHPQIFERLVGLETEYAIRFRPHSAQGEPPTKLQLYRSLVEALRRRVLLAEAKHFKEGVFNACGGAVWFEAERPAAGGGLIEGATPECRGPRQVLTYQRAQDRLLAESSKAASVPGEFSLIKNDRDAENNVYGAQENYEATLAEGWRLWAWRASLIAMTPLMFATWIGLILLIIGVLMYLAIAAVIYLPMTMFTSRPKRLARHLFGRDLTEGIETGGPAPPWMEGVLLFWTRATTAPLAAGLWLASWCFAFRETRRRLLPFLISRPVLAGSGMLDRQGRFWLADKGPAMNAVLGYGGFFRERPIFTVGHFFKTLCAEACFSASDFFDLFRRRQRLQIALGDSNMCERAELLRVGSTLLVLDAIEAGYIPRMPRPCRPIRTLHGICGDPTLSAEIPFADGTRSTALDVQRVYLAACQRMVAAAEHSPRGVRRGETLDEAREILRLWESVLDQLDECKRAGEPTDSLFGVLDWVTKFHLLERAGVDSPWEARKKLDIRYHELSPDGYYTQLLQSGWIDPYIAEEEIARAMRTPPPNSPATVRGHYIREFSQDCERFSVNWKRVVFSDDSVTRTVRLSRYQRRRPPADPPDRDGHRNAASSSE
ncbi:MAG: proteasome accessory factor PafA2 family protein [Pirellulaceae bacterium]